MTDIIQIIKRIEKAKRDIVTRDDTLEEQKSNIKAFAELDKAIDELSTLIDDGK